jgi:2,4-dienoyl-CoA reductase-like NADH-dependent reductase (Old Yellow Enzyme family)
MPDDRESADLAALSEPLALLDTLGRRLVAPNRIVYQPMEGNDANEDGSPSEITFARYRARAEGRAGIDFVEALAVSEDGRARPRQLRIDEATEAGFAALVTAYREVNADTPLLFQLTHSGRFAAERVSPYPIEGVAARLLTDADVPALIEHLVTAVKVAHRAGADGIDFKHCHGYLYGAMLGPANSRRDGWSYGGERFRDRTRFLEEALARMTAEVPPDRFLYCVRFSAFEGIPGGFGSRDAESAEEDPECRELVALVRLLEAAGVALLNQSSGVPEITPHLVRQTNEDPTGFAHHQARAALVKRSVGVPVVGSGYSYARDGRNRLPGDDPREKCLLAHAGRALREGRVDFIGIGRQSLADPRFAAKLLGGRADEILWDDACNRCAIAMRSGIPAACATHDPEAKRRFRELRRRL